MLTKEQACQYIANYKVFLKEPLIRGMIQIVGNIYGISQKEIEDRVNYPIQSMLNDFMDKREERY